MGGKAETAAQRLMSAQGRGATRLESFDMKGTRRREPALGSTD